ncbi:hypothetical protein LUZ60_009793 [Juncus effusus]|nr:hypothetical protein LUZ60_009793 [Juncus effusus]
MEAQEVHKTPDPAETLVERKLSTRSSPRCKTLGGGARIASDLAWAKTGAHVKGQLWWPARVLGRRDGRAHVSLFGEAHVGRSSWCNASQVKPFFGQNLAQMARQSDSKPFLLAFQEALKFASRSLQSELTCDCIPLESRPMVNSEGLFELGIFNLAPLEFLNRVKEAALNVSSTNWEESVRLKSWVFALSQGYCDGNVGFCQRKLMDELVDKLDLDLDISMNEKEEVLKERDLASVLQENGANTNINGSRNSTGKNKKKKRESEKVLERESCSTSTKIKIEEQETVSSRRERKKSKYLSYPYTDLPQKIDSSYIMKLDLETPKEKKIEEKKNSDEGDFVNLESLSAKEILSDLLCTGINPLYLKRKQSERTIRLFFAKYRDCTFIDGSSYESYQNNINKNRIFEQRNENMGQESGSGSIPGHLRKSDFNMVNLKKCDRKIKEEPDLMDSDINNIPNLNNISDNNIPNLNNKSNEKEKIDSNRPGPSRILHFEKVITGSDSNNKRKKNNKSSGNKVKHSENNANNSNNYAFNGVTMLNFGEGSSEITEESRTPMLNNNLSQNGNNPVRISDQSSEQSKKRKKNSENNTPGITIPKRRGRKKKAIPEQQSYPNPAALLLAFTNPNPNIKTEPGTSSSTGTGTSTSVPSRELLLSTFSKFGSLIETETELHRDSCTARVVFARSTDAELAYNSSDKLGPFGPPFASCRLHYLPPITPPAQQQPPGQQQPPAQQKVMKAPPLIDIRKNLEMMISSLKSGSGPGLVKVENNGSDVTRPDMRENLMGEMQGLLIKVEKLLQGNGATAGTSYQGNGATAGTSSIPPP